MVVHNHDTTSGAVHVLAHMMNLSPEYGEGNLLMPQNEMLQKSLFET